jgi:rhodanese-related sulfurtransferase
MDDSRHRTVKTRLYGHFAGLARALANPHRFEALELLAQGERTVESLARETGASVANISQHLKVLRAAGLVETRRAGVFVHYRLADDSLSSLLADLRRVAERRSAELERLVRTEFHDRASIEPVSFEDLQARARRGDVVILDTRPTHEYAAGHIPGALSVPVEDVRRQLARIPKKKLIVAYCRGPYCVYADRAVEILTSEGRRARRLKDGFPEWRTAGFPVAVGDAPGVM